MQTMSRLEAIWESLIENISVSKLGTSLTGSISHGKSNQERDNLVQVHDH